MNKWILCFVLCLIQSLSWAQFNQTSTNNEYVPDYIKLVTKEEDIDPTKGSIVVLPFRFKNQFKPDYPLMNFGFAIEKMGGPYIRGSILTKFTKESKDGWRYYPNQIWLVPGKYKITILVGISQAYAVIARVLMPSSIEFEVTEVGKMIYMGRTDFMNVRRTALSDAPAGMPTPAVDQALSGFANGTVVVNLVKEPRAEWLDQYNYLPSVPRLKDYEIKDGIISKYVLTGSDRQERAKTFSFDTPEANEKNNPLITPSKSDFADIKDVEKFLTVTTNPELKRSYEQFLRSRLTRAIVISPDGKKTYAASSDSPFDSPVLSAFYDCQQNHGEGCKFYAIDSDVVWK